jgi:hypothetical protein
MSRSRNLQADALAAEAAAAGVPQADATKAIAEATGISERQARRYAHKPLNTADSLERLAHRLQDMLVRADAMNDFKSATALAKQLNETYHRLDLARHAEADAYDRASAVF